MFPVPSGATAHHNRVPPGFRDPDPLGFAAQAPLLWDVALAPIAPQLRGHVRPHQIAYWRHAGWAVHQVGQAAYVHGDGLHLLFGVWEHPAERPAWADHLGHASPGYLRRLIRIDREQRGRWYVRAADGRFLAKLPWWRVRPVTAYRFERPRPSTIEQDRILVAMRRERLNDRGLWS